MSVKNSTNTRSIADEINETVTVTVRVTSKESGGLLELVTEKLSNTAGVVSVSVESIKGIEPKNGYTEVTVTGDITHRIPPDSSKNVKDVLEGKVCLETS